MPGSSPAAVFKCVDSSGSVTYQQQPCIARTAPNDAGDASKPLVTSAVGTGKIEVGMSADEIKRLLGPPDHVRVTESNPPDRTEMWVYLHPQQSRPPLAITLRHGSVVRWTNVTY